MSLLFVIKTMSEFCPGLSVLGQVVNTVVCTPLWERSFSFVCSHLSLGELSVAESSTFLLLCLLN